MENQGRDMSYNSAEMGSQGYQQTGQQQISRDDQYANQGSRNTAQNPNFINQTGDGVSKMAQGAVGVAQGAAQGVMSLAKGTVVGAANVAQGTGSAVKRTLGMDANEETGATNNNPSTRM